MALREPIPGRWEAGPSLSREWTTGKASHYHFYTEFYEGRDFSFVHYCSHNTPNSIKCIQCIQYLFDE